MEDEPRKPAPPGYSTPIQREQPPNQEQIQIAQEHQGYYSDRLGLDPIKMSGKRTQPGNPLMS
jgi:hypothetical protein